ncbi:hypothetical protein D3D02_17940 [Halobellus sp. Atlit-38R]|nr:hypothetical protein D3D02_17940 [Halobellus sp. Atlit-38R]
MRQGIAAILQAATSKTSLDYYDTAFLDLQSYLGLTGTAANQGSRIFDEETTRENGGPDGDTHLHYIKQLEAIGVISRTVEPIDGRWPRHGDAGRLR